MQQNIDDLIIDILSTDTFETCIRYCLGTQTLILEIRKGFNAVYFPRHNNATQSKLSISLFHKNDLGETIQHVILALKEKFEYIINDNKFSAIPNIDAREVAWEHFNTEDILFIQESFKAL